MPHYRVLVTRDITESATIAVEASSQEQAVEKALEHARHVGDPYSPPYIFPWEPTDDLARDPYCGDPDNDAEQISEDTYQEMMANQTQANRVADMVQRAVAGRSTPSDGPLLIKMFMKATQETPTEVLRTIQAEIVRLTSEKNQDNPEDESGQRPS